MKRMWLQHVLKTLEISGIFSYSARNCSYSSVIIIVMIIMLMMMMRRRFLYWSVCVLNHPDADHVTLIAWLWSIWWWWMCWFWCWLCWDLLGLRAPDAEAPLGVVGQRSAAPQRHQEAAVLLLHLGRPVLVTLPLWTGSRHWRLHSYHLRGSNEWTSGSI